MVKLIIFDAGGVLHASNHAVSEDLCNVLGLSEEAVAEIWATYIVQLGSGKINEVEFWSLVKSRFDTRAVDVTENLLGRKFAETLQPNWEIYEYIDELKTKGLQLVVLSDTIEPHAKVLRDEGLYKPFDQVFLSYKMGRRKPDLGAYCEVLKRTRTMPGEAIFIDDTEDNVWAARELGIEGVVYVDIGSLRKWVGEILAH